MHIRRSLYQLLAIGLLIAFFPVKAFPESSAAKHIIILTTSDIESQLDPYPLVTEKDGRSETMMVGGMARLAAMVKRIRAENPGRVILVSSGDDLMGKYFSIFHGKETYTLMNSIGYDVITLGNHEFDYGIKHLKEAIDIADFPIVVSNMDFRGTSLFKRIQKYYIKEVNGVKIGFIGLMTPSARQVTNIQDPIDLDIDIYNVSDEYVGLLRHFEDVDIVVALTHIGIDLDLHLAKTIWGIDVICGGHSHTLFPTGKAMVVEKDEEGRKEKTLIVESGEKGGYLGRLDIKVKEGKVIANKWQVILLDETVPFDAETASIIEAFKSRLPEKILLGTSLADLDARREVVRKGESNLGNFITDSMKERFNVDIALINGGAIRGDCVYKKGDIYSDTLLDFFPFDNYAVKFELTGRELRDILELGVSEYENEKGKFLQVSGVKYAFDPGGEAMELLWDEKGNAVGIKKEGNRIVSVSCEENKGSYEPCGDDKTYTVVVGSYMAGGGDGYFMLKNKRGLNTYIDLKKVIEHYITDKKEIDPRVEGRIIKAGDN